MIISIKIIFFIIILFSISLCEEFAKKEKYLTYEEEYLINSHYNFAENDNLINDNYFQYNETNDKNIKEAISYFPASYLTYIIDGFLPKLKNQESKIFKRIKKSSCFNYYFTERKDEINKVIKYSGKSYPDFGDEEGCIRNNMSFILFCIHFNINNSSNYEGNFHLLPFISNGYSFYGLCIKNVSNCTYLPEELKPLINNHDLMKDIYHLETFINNNDTNGKEFYKSTKYNIFLTLFYLFIIYLAIRIIISIIGIRFFKEKEKIRNSSSSSSDEEEEEEEEEKQEKKSKKSKIDNVEKAENSHLLIEKDDIVNNISNKQKYKLFYSIYRFCSFKHGYENLFKYKGYLFNETDLSYLNNINLP